MDELEIAIKATKKELKEVGKVITSTSKKYNKTIGKLESKGLKLNNQLTFLMNKRKDIEVVDEKKING